MKKLLIATLFLMGVSFQVQAQDLVELSDTCEETAMNMIKCGLAEDVGTDDAIESMKLRANMLNFKLVGHMPLSEQVAAMGGKSTRMEIFQFCDAMIAAQMVKFSIAFAGYLPCRISVIEDAEGKTWLVTLNMDKTMSDASLPKELQGLGLQVRNNIYSIITAGAEGDL
jgi:uncharacterized protein (DUF302 family)